MKHISMGLSSIEECPIDIQISRSAREKYKLTSPHPRFLIFSYLCSDFHETWYIASIGAVWLIGYEMNKLPPQPEPQLQILRFLFMVWFSPKWRAAKRPVSEEEGLCNGAKAPLYMSSTGARLEWRRRRLLA